MDKLLLNEDYIRSRLREKRNCRKYSDVRKVRECEKYFF